MESVERVPVVIAEEPGELARLVAGRIGEVIRARRASGARPVLGLATGSTPIGVYRELVRLHREEGLDFSDVVTFNLDEYVPMDPGSEQSYHRFMREHLFDRVNVDPANVHLPRGDLPREEIEAHCAAYEAAIRRAGGIDFQLLGIGQTGHIGFNEPGSSAASRTRLVALDGITRRGAASDFFGEANVPLEAVTMGVASILAAREIALMATGEHKAAIVKRAVEGPVSPAVAATYLQDHPNATFYLDAAAAADLTRVATPWLLGEPAWDRELETRALIWLSEVTGKSVLRLGDADYREHHLSGLLARRGSSGTLNGEVFNALIAKVRGRSKLPRGRRVLFFSPHPDDDVISAGGILNKLHQNGNEILVAYQTSGNIAVFDHEVRRYLDFLLRASDELGLDRTALAATVAGVEGAFARKRSGDPDEALVLAIKKRIRETEAVSAIETFGMRPEQARFLDLPFYRTGRVRKEPVGERDVAIVRALLEERRPELVFVAGDLSDPHGTHRQCKEAVERALGSYEGPSPEVWYYRGAWQEWPVEEADVLVPMSQEELKGKISAIFKHQSQKDRAPFPGLDDREFWERVEERNQETARTVDRLGLPEYYAMEAYVVRRDGRRPEWPAVATSSLGAVPAGPDGTDA